LELEGFVYISGNFSFEKSADPVTVTLTDESTVSNVEMMTIGATDVTAFAGVNGPADNDGAMGLSMSGVNIALVLMTVADPLAGDTRSWMALKADAEEISFIGIDDITIAMTDFSILYNMASGVDDLGGPNVAVDFTVTDFNDDSNPEGFFGIEVVDSVIEIDFDSDLLEVGGSVEIGLAGFVYVSGDFAFEKSSDPITVALSDGITTADVEILTIGASNANAFIGVNGPASNTGAMGVSLSDVTFAMAIMKVSQPATPEDTRSWTSLTTHVGQASVIGITGFTLDVNSFVLELNQAGGDDLSGENSLFVDFIATDFGDLAGTGGGLDVSTGQASSEELIFEDEVFNIYGNLSLDVFGFFYVTGDFAFEKDSGIATLVDTAEEVEVEMLKIGASNLNAFVGVNGPAGNSGAVGFSLTGVEFALALIKAKPDPVDIQPDLRNWMALEANVLTAAFDGIPNVDITVNSFDLYINRASGTNNGVLNTKVIDFEASDFDDDGFADGGLNVATGETTSIDILFNKAIFQASGNITLDLFGFVTGSADFAFSKQTIDVDVDTNGIFDPLNGDLDDAQLTIFALSNVNVFVGAGGIGFNVTGGRLGLVQISPNSDAVTAGDTRSYLAVKASLDNASLDGISGLTAMALNLSVDVNQASGAINAVDAAALDFSRALALEGGGGFGALIDPGAYLNPALTGQELLIDFHGELFQASGSFELNLFDFVIGSADFAFIKQTVDVKLSDTETLDNADMIILALSNADIFVGVNGVGFEVIDAELGIAQISAADATDSRSYMAVKAHVANASLVGISGLTASVSDINLMVNRASGENAGTLAEALDWTIAVDLDDTDGQAFNDVVDPGQYLDPAVDLSLDYTAELFKAAGSIDLDLFGFVTGSGNFAFVKQTADVRISGTEILDDASLVMLALDDVDAFVGVNGVGFGVTGGQLGLAQITPAGAGDTRSYTAIRGGLGTASLEGINGLTAELSNLAVEINQASGENLGVPAVPLDWSTAIDLDDSDGQAFGDVVDPGQYLDIPVDMTMAYTEELLQVSGHIELGLFGFVTGSADFALKQETVDVDLDGNGTIGVNDLTDASLATFALNNATLFIGVNSIGFEIAGARLGLAYIKSTDPTDTRSYLGLKGHITSASFVGIDAFDITINTLIVEINQASGAKGAIGAEALDWTGALDLDDDLVFGEVADADADGVYEVSDDLLDPGLNLDPALGDQELALDFEGELLRIKGFLTLRISQFVFVTGSFAFAKGEPIYVTTAGSAVSTQMSLMTIGASGVYAFAGIGGPYWVDSDGDGDIDGNDTPASDGALGITISNASFGMALLKPVVAEGQPPAEVSYYALKATGSAALVGINDITLAADDMIIEVNASSDGSSVVDFSQILPVGYLAVPTGPGTDDIALDYDNELIRVAGYVTLTISEFVHVSGSFAFEQGPAENVTLSDTNVIEVSTVKVGIGNGYAFAGIGGPYWTDSNGDGIIDENDTPDSEGALGVILGDVEFALALMKPVVAQGQPPSTVSYYALKARGSAALVGIDGLTLAVDKMEIQVNGTSVADSSVVVDFVTSFPGTVPDVPVGMPVSTGPAADDVVYIDFAAAILQVTGYATLTISEFVHISGYFAFQKGELLDVTVVGTALPVEVSVLKIGASSVYAFVGLGGPYWIDSDEDGDIDIDDTPDADGAIGVTLENVEFALAMMTPTAEGAAERYYALKATGGAELVGVNGIDFQADDILIEINATTAVDPAAVVDFKASFGPDGLGVKTGPGVDDVMYIDLTEDILMAYGHVVLGIVGVELDGNVFFEKTTNSFGATIIKVAFTEVHFSLFGGDDALVSITEASGFFVINDKGLAGKLSISIDFNIPNIIIDFDTVSLTFNTTNEDIHEEFNLPGGTEILDVAAGPYVMVKATDVSLGIEVSGTPYTIDADVLQIEQITLPDTTKVIKIAAVGVSANALGIELTDGWGGFIFYNDGMAGIAKTQLGFGDVLEGEITLAVNTTNRNVDDTITVDASDLRIKISANTFALAASNTTLQFGDYFMLKGDYSLNIVDSGLATERTLIAAANVRLFLGRGPPEREDGTLNPDAIGVLVQASKVGIVKYADGTFAVHAVGSASIIGLGDGIYVEGTLEVNCQRIDNHGSCRCRIGNS